MNLFEKMDAKLFNDAKVREALHEMTVEAITIRYGEPRVHIVHSRPLPSGKPALASDDPAVVQAMGRCAVARTRLDGAPRLGKLHGAECAWCAYPVGELVAACEWGDWSSRFVLVEALIWRGDDGSTYVREGRSPHYGNPAWRDYWALPLKERERRIAAASALVTA